MYFFSSYFLAVVSLWCTFNSTAKCVEITHQCALPADIYKFKNGDTKLCMKNLYRTFQGVCVYSATMYYWILLYRCKGVTHIEMYECTDSDPSCTCYSSYLDCSEQRMTTFPDIVNNVVELFYLDGNFLNGIITNKTFRLYSHIKLLDLSRNDIEKLEAFTFQNLTSLKLLNIGNNKMKALERYVFDGLHSLDLLDLSNNQITKLTSDNFSGLKELTSLDLCANKITAIENTTFTKLNNLIVLDLSNNLLTNIAPNTFENLNLLRLLYLNNNVIETIENTTFHGLRNLLQLDLTGNNLKWLLPHVFQHLENIVNLMLNKNNIESIDDFSFNALKNLSNLMLAGNRLTNITSKMFKEVKSLTTLDLGENSINYVEDNSFNELDKLKKLNLSSCQLTKLTKFHNNTNLKYLYIIGSGINTIEENSFNGLANLISLKLSRGKLTKLSTNTFQNTNHLAELHLDNNEIETIEILAFNGLYDLWGIDLSYNAIEELNGSVFKPLESLRVLFLRGNKIVTIENHLWSGLSILFELDLGENKLTHLTTQMFQNLTTLEILHLDYNEITSIKSFGNLERLSALGLNNNKLKKISSKTFKRLPSLTEIQLEYNVIQTIEDFSFITQKLLGILNLSHNRIHKLTDKTFHGLISLKKLGLENNSNAEFDRNVFESNTKLELLETDEFRICCLAKRVKNCTAPRDKFSSCEDLMKSSVLRVCIWVLGVTALINNVYVIILRMRNKVTTRTSEIHSFLIKNLALSDLFMGIYLLIIAIADSNYRGEYYLHDLKWRKSDFCSFAGFLSTFSSELTVFTLTVISLDRLFSITFPYENQVRKINRTRFLMALGWIFTFIIAALPHPFLRIKYFEHFYARSGVCLALHITNDEPNGWEYSVAIFIVLNALSFVIIAVSYILMFLSARKTSRVVQSTNKAPKSAMAFRMTLLVAATAACWIPIIILGIRSLLGNEISPDVYPWIAVFVLPLNAALNPILYTLTSMKCVQISYQNGGFSDRLRFRWPCYWE